MSDDVISVPLGMRVRFGVAQFPDGWNVVIELDGDRNVYDPTVPTEAEALDLLASVRNPFIEAVGRMGVEVVHRRV